MLQVLLYQINMLVLEKHKVIHRKLFWGFKYFRFKSSFKNPALKVSSTKEVLNIRTGELADMLDCTNHTAQNIISRNTQILTTDSESFIRNAKFCSKYLKLSDVVEFPHLITLNPSLLQHRYFSLLELGCSNINASYVFKYLQLIKKSPKMLENEGIYISYKENSDYFKKALSDSNFEIKPEVTNHIQNLYQDGSTLRKIRELVNAEILASYLDCSIAKAHLMFRRYPPVRLQSIGNTLKTLDVLVQKYNFPISKIFYTPTILALHHETLDNFFEKIPCFLGVNTIELVQRVPLLLRRSVNSLRQVEEILQDFNINDQQLLCCPKVITFSDRTLQERLKLLCKSEVFEVWKKHKKFLWLVYYFSRLDSRMKLLEAVNVPHSINAFTSSDSKFNDSCYFDRRRSNIYDISHYLAQALNLNEKVIFEKLHGHPNSDTFSLPNCSKVVEFLLKSGISKKQLFNGLDIIVYDIDIVTMYFNELSNHPRCQPFSEWISHYNLIQLLIYVIEVDNGFRGSRSNATEMRSDDSSEELSLSDLAF